MNPAAPGGSLRRSGLGHDVNGDIGSVGTAAAAANAVYPATGKRLREMPITLDMLWGDLRGSEAKQ